MGHQSYVLLCIETALSNHIVVITKSICDVHLLRSPCTSLLSTAYIHCIVITTKLDSQLGKGQRKRKGSIWVSLDPITISFLEWHWINQLWGRTILLFYHQCFSKLAILHSISCLLANFVPSHIHTYIKPIWQMGTLEFHLHTNFMEKVRCRQKYTYQTFFVKKDVK